MSLVTRFYGPNAKGSKLTIKEMDDNLYYLQSLGVSGLTYSSDILTITNPTGGTLSVNIGTGPIGNPIYIPSGETVTIPTNTQNFIYGDIVVGGTLLIEENSELIILNGDLYLSGGTLSGSGQTVLVDLPTFNNLITSGNYLNGTLTLSTDNGSDLIVNGFYTGSTDVFTTGASYNNGIIYFDTNITQSAYTVNISSLTGDSNTFITGVTYNNLTNTLVLTDNTNNNFSAYINEFSGLTINGSLSATTLYGDGSNLTGISTQDTYVTGFTYDNNNTLTISQNTGSTLNVTITNMSGLTINGSLSATTISGDTFYGDGSNLTGISTQDTYVTGGTYSNGTASFTNNVGNTFNVTGFTTNNRTFNDINTNNTYNGDILKIGSGTTISGYIYYLENTNIWTLANASSVSTSNGLLGISIGTNPQTDGMLVYGFANSSVFSGTTGSPLYLTTNNGLISENPPSGIGYVIRIVGYKLGNTNSIIFKPDPTWIELT
jgi:hypothetical protein